MIKYSAILILLATLGMGGSCGKDKNKNESVEFKFEIPLSISPVKDSINLGDTLILEVNFPDTVREVLSNKYYMLRDFDFKTRIFFEKLIDSTKSLSQQPGNAASYTIISQIGGITNIGETFGGVNYLYENNSYKLRVKLVTKAKGVFCIGFYYQDVGFNRILDFIDLGPAILGGKKQANLINIWHVINNEQTNFHLYEANCKTGNLSNPDENNFEKQATYTFVVK